MPAEAPFGSLGGDSLLVVSVAATAARHGLTLQLEVQVAAVESMTIEQLVASGQAWRGERWARPQRQERRAKSALLARGLDPSTSALDTATSGVAGAGGVGAVGGRRALERAGGQRAVQLAILERDGHASRTSACRLMVGLLEA